MVTLQGKSRKPDGDIVGRNKPACNAKDLRLRQADDSMGGGLPVRMSCFS